MLDTQTQRVGRVVEIATTNDSWRVYNTLLFVFCLRCTNISHTVTQYGPGLPKWGAWNKVRLLCAETPFRGEDSQRGGGA